MGTTKSRRTRRNNSRPAALSFLTNISLGTENDISHKVTATTITTTKEDDSRPDHDFSSSTGDTGRLPPDVAASSLISSDSNVSGEAVAGGKSINKRNARAASTSLAAAPPVMTTSVAASAELEQKSRRRWSVESSSSSEQVKLTREDSERPIASEKIKKKSHHADKENDHGGIMSVVRYYTEKIRFSTGKRKAEQATFNRGYLQQQLAGDNNKRRPAQSYAHFLCPSHSLEENQPIPEGAYDPCFLDNDSYNKFGYLSSSQGTVSRPSDLKRELNDQFRLMHPEIPPEITLSKIRSIKAHLTEIGKAVDLEISSVAHAFVYFEKLVIKNVVTKKNRKLIAACCLFLATKVNEAKGTWFEPLFQAIDDELDVDSKEVREHEFAVFADLEFNLYIPSREFMPHFERIFQVLDYKSIEDYLGTSTFYKVKRT